MKKSSSFPVFLGKKENTLEKYRRRPLKFPQGTVKLPFFRSFSLYPSSSTVAIFLMGLSVCPAMWNSQNGQDDITTSAPHFLISSPLRLPSAAASSGMPDFTPLRNHNRWKASRQDPLPAGSADGVVRECPDREGGGRDRDRSP